MKNGVKNNIKKRLLLIICCAVFLCGIALLGSVQGVAEASQSTYCSNSCSIKEGVPLFRPVLETVKYDLNDYIPLTFTIEADSSAWSVEYDTYGFNITRTPILAQSIVTTTITLNGANRILGSPKFTIWVNLSNGTQLEANIFGVIEDGSLYVSGCSFDDARNIYFVEMLESGVMSEKEYALALNAQYAGGVVEFSDSVQTRANDTCVTGILRWQDDHNNWHFLQGIKVTVYDEDNFLGIDKNLGTVYTNANGEYTLWFDNNKLLSGSGRNIYVKVWPAGDNIEVKNASGSDVYFWQSTTSWDVATGSITTKSADFNMGTTASPDNRGRAFQISQALIFADRYVTTMRGSSIASLTARFPMLSGTSYYQSNTIYLLGTSSDMDYADWDVIMHEYGHHAQNKMGISNSPGGSHSSTANLADDRGNKSEGVRLAWGESWPTIFGELAQQYYAGNLTNIVGVADGGYTDSMTFPALGGTPLYLYNTITTRGGEAVERSIMGVLWDLYDNDSGEAHDNIALGHQAFWNLSVSNANGKATTFSDFAKNYHSLYSSFSQIDNFGKLIQYYKMAPENLALTAGGDAKQNPPTFTWTANGTSSSLQNNRFDLIFFNSNLTQFFYITNITTMSRTLSVNEWNSVLNLSGGSYFVDVVGYQTSSPVTGGYASEFVSFSKPLFTTELNGNNITITGVTPGVTLPNNLTIPSQINGKTVTQISDSAFAGCTSITNLTLPNTLTFIGDQAFLSCTSLQSLTIPSSVTSIGTSVFEGCLNLSNLTFSSGAGGLVFIGSRSFANCYSLTNISFPTSPTLIGNQAFLSCTALQSLTLSSGIINIGTSAFEGCLNLSNLTFTSINHLAIGSRSFANCYSLTNISFPNNNQTIIDNQAFLSCTSLYSLTIPNNVTSIGSQAFIGCTSLTNLSFISGYNSLKIGSYAFSGNSNLCNISFPTNPTQIDSQAFSNCNSLYSLTIPNNVTSIGSSAFSNCFNLSDLSFTSGPNSVTIGQQAFFNCNSLYSLTIPNSITSIGTSAFSNCLNLSDLSFTSGPNLVTIGQQAFSNCVSLSNISFPTTPTQIGQQAFTNCNSLQDLIIPNNTSIGTQAFHGLTNLINLSFTPGPNSQTIGMQAFAGCTSLHYLTIPNNITSIGISSFANCTGLTSVLFIQGPNTQVIGIGSFTSCSNLFSVVLPNNLSTVPHLVFYGCTSLTSITIPSSVTLIDNIAFHGCTSLTDVYINRPSPSITTLGDNVFSECTSLTNIYITDINSETAYKSSPYWNSYKTLIKYTNTATVTLIDNGVVIGTINSRTGTYLPLPTPTKPNKSFYGYTTTQQGYGIVYNNTYFIKQNMTLYAQYRTVGPTHNLNLFQTYSNISILPNEYLILTYTPNISDFYHLDILLSSGLFTIQVNGISYSVNSNIIEDFYLDQSIFYEIIITNISNTTLTFSELTLIRNGYSYGDTIEIVPDEEHFDIYIQENGTLTLWINPAYSNCFYIRIEADQQYDVYVDGVYDETSSSITNTYYFEAGITHEITVVNTYPGILTIMYMMFLQG